MNRSRFAFCLVLATLTALAACDGSDGVVDASVDDGEFNQDKMADVTVELLLPTLRHLPVVAGSLQLDDGGPAKHDDTEGECETTTFGCRSGHLEICTGSGSIAFEFHDCVTASRPVNGSVTMTLTSDTTGDLVFDLTEGDLHLAGEVTLELTPGCITETMNGFSVSTPSKLGFMTGRLEFCGTNPVTGEAELTVTGPEFGSFTFGMELGESGVDVGVTGMISGDLLARCEIALGGAIFIPGEAVTCELL